MIYLGYKDKNQPSHWELNYSHCLIRLNISSNYNDSTVFKKSSFQKISHLNALESKFDIDDK